MLKDDSQKEGVHLGQRKWEDLDKRRETFPGKLKCVKRQEGWINYTPVILWTQGWYTEVRYIWLWLHRDGGPLCHTLPLSQVFRSQSTPYHSYLSTPFHLPPWTSILWLGLVSHGTWWHTLAHTSDAGWLLGWTHRPHSHKGLVGTMYTPLPHTLMHGWLWDEHTDHIPIRISGHYSIH